MFVDKDKTPCQYPCCCGCAAAGRLKKNALLKMVPCSRTAVRERWHIETLKDRPRLAAALDLVLGSEEGAERVKANPLTVEAKSRYGRIAGPLCWH